MQVEVIRKHPFKGRTKRPGDRYEMNAQEFRVFSALGHVRLVVEEKPKSVAKSPQVNRLGKPKGYNRRDMRSYK